MQTPGNIQLIGDEVAFAWSDGAESFVRQDLLRRASPSAETQGERDVFGNQYGGGSGGTYSGVRVLGWQLRHQVRLQRRPQDRALHV